MQSPAVSPQEKLRESQCNSIDFRFVSYRFFRFVARCYGLKTSGIFEVLRKFPRTYAYNISDHDLKIPDGKVDILGSSLFATTLHTIFAV